MHMHTNTILSHSHHTCTYTPYTCIHAHSIKYTDTPHMYMYHTAYSYAHTNTPDHLHHTCTHTLHYIDTIQTHTTYTPHRYAHTQMPHHTIYAHHICTHTIQTHHTLTHIQSWSGDGVTAASRGGMQTGGPNSGRHGRYTEVAPGTLLLPSPSHPPTHHVWGLGTSRVGRGLLPTDLGEGTR